MRITVNNDGTKVQLDAAERRALRKAASILHTLSKHVSCQHTTTASEWMATMVSMWATEEETK